VNIAVDRFAPVDRAASSDGDTIRLPASAMRDAEGVPARELIRRHLAVQYANVLSDERCRDLVRGVYAARRHWIENFGGAQFTLGRAWYTDLEQDRVDDYFAGARRSDAIVDAAVPGLRALIFDLASALLRAPVVQRPAWCGPGIHIFPARGDVAATGGDVHFDTEGLSVEQKARREPTLTLVLMLQPPDEGGGLHVWNRRWSGEADDDVVDPADAATAIAHPHAGDLTAIDSYTLHQIQSFRGARDRISATAHAVHDAGRWELWF
jgi:hypothetical protein